MLQPYRPPRPVMGIAFVFTYTVIRKLESRQKATVFKIKIMRLPHESQYKNILPHYHFPLRAGIAQLVKKLATGCTTEGLEFESR
jgi:hypothetical protein